jgi:hypothetical protein
MSTELETSYGGVVVRGDERPAGVPVAPRAEGRARDQHVGRVFLEVAEQRGERLVLVLGEVVVPAGERRDDLDVFELGRQPAARADRAVEAHRWSLRLVLTAQAGEELVQVVDGLHSVRAPRLSWPIWFAAPR